MKSSLRLAAADMDVVGLFVSDGGFPLDVAAVRTIVMAHEKTHLVGQVRTFWIES
jgi:hypothetical protein